MFDFQSLFTETPKPRQPSGLGAGNWAEDDDDRFPAFQSAWRQGADNNSLFGPNPFDLKGSVGTSGADNHRPDVAKVETFLGQTGHYQPLLADGPNGYHSDTLDRSIKAFQKDNGLKVDGLLNPKGPTIGTLGSVLGGGAFGAPDKPDAGSSPAKGIVQGEWDWMDKKMTPDWSVGTGIGDPFGIHWPRPSGTEPRLPDPLPTKPPADPGPTITIGHGGTTMTLPIGRPRPKDPFAFHTISEDGASAHDSYAKTLAGDTDPSQTAQTLARVIKDYGNQGKGDVADLLGRFAQVDADKAKVLQDALHRQTGERLPFRVAPLGEGFKEPTQEEQLAGAPKTPFGSSAGADRWAAGNMAKALLRIGDYSDAITHFQRDRSATQPYLAAVHEEMAGKNPLLAMKFASQMNEAGLASNFDQDKARQSANAGGGTEKIKLILHGGPEPEGQSGGGSTSSGGNVGTEPGAEVDIDNSSASVAIADPRYGDGNTPPEWKKDTFASQPGAWKNFNASVTKLPGLSDTEKFVYGQIYAAEGGDKVDPTSGASSGITKGVLASAKASGTIPGLDKVKSPGDLNADQRAAVMKHYMDGALKKVGGSKAIGDIGDRHAANAMADALYRFGPTGGAAIIRQAINEVNGDKVLPVNKTLDAQALNEFQRLTDNPKTRKLLLDRIVLVRGDKAPTESERNERFRPN